MKKIRFFLHILGIFFVQPGSTAVLDKSKIWPRNSKLNVIFIDGTHHQKQHVIEFAPLWLKNSSLSFSFYDSFKQAPPETHIRISFQYQTGSTLGNHGDYYSKKPTMLLHKLGQKNLPVTAVKRFVLHEFGHALGFEHEYRNPKWPFGYAAIQKHITNCIPQMKKAGYLINLAQQKCLETNRPLDRNNVFSTVYDELSIMNYPQRILLKDGTNKQINTIKELSYLDKLAIKQWYGKQTLINETKPL